MSNFEDMVDSVDAAIFTGDSIHNAETLGYFKVYLERWDREVKKVERMIELEQTEKLKLGTLENCA